MCTSPGFEGGTKKLRPARVVANTYVCMYVVTSLPGNPLSPLSCRFVFVFCLHALSSFSEAFDVAALKLLTNALAADFTYVEIHGWCFVCCV